MNQYQNDGSILKMSEVIDPRQSMRIQKIQQAKKQIEAETSEYQQEVLRIQNEIKQYKEEIKQKQMAEIHKH